MAFIVTLRQQLAAQKPRSTRSPLISRHSFYSKPFFGDWMRLCWRADSSTIQRVLDL
jgi:hypothetical protein